MNEGVDVFLTMCKDGLHRVNLCHRYANNEAHSYMNMWMNELNESFILNVKNNVWIAFSLSEKFHLHFCAVSV